LTLQLEHQLAEIAAGVEQAQCVGKGIDTAFAHVLAKLQAALLVPAAEIGQGLAIALGKVEDDEALTRRRMTRTMRMFFGPGGGSAAP
jgi:hypothetical protein